MRSVIGTFYQAEKQKNRHSSWSRLPVIMPLLTVLLSAGMTHVYFQVDGYNWWYMAMFPALIALICTLEGQRERRLRYQAVWSLPVDIKRIWDGKVLCGVRCAAISMAVLFAAVLGMSTWLEHGMHLAFQIEVSWEQQVIAAVLLLITFLWQIPVCLMMHQKLGTFLTVLLHMGIHAACAATVSLESWFFLIPYAIPSRLMCVVLKVLPNGLPARAGEMTYAPELMQGWSLPVGVLVSLVYFLGFWYLGRRIYERQVGR